MADSREMTYGLGFDAGGALDALNRIGRGFDEVEQAEQRAQTGADEVRSALNDIGRTAASVASEAGAAAERIGGAFEDAGDDASNKFKQMGADASSFGSAFRKTTAAAIKDGQSLAKSIQTGVGGALAFTGKKFTTFKNDFVKGAKNIGTALLHPIQTIKGKMADAFEDAERAADGLGTEAQKTENELKDMGDAGAGAGGQIKDAITGALKAFLGIEAIKAAAGAIKDFVSSALEAAAATENTAAKFDRLFEGTGAEQWADNYASAVNRSTNEVKGFLVQNQAMYSQMGITGDAATQLSEITTSLAYDFGNAFKMSDAEALTALQSAIQGDASAVAEFGINLDDATLQAEAMKMGISGEISELDAATQAQIRMNAILGQSSDIQKAAIEQTGGMVNSTKSLKGIWDNFMATAGAKFTPVMEKLFNTIIKAWPKIEPALMGLVDILAEGLGQVIPPIAELATSLLPVLADIIGVVFEAVTPLLPVFTSLAQQILPPLTAIFGQLASSILPPLTDIFMTLVNSVLMPLMPVIQNLIDALLPPFVELLGMIAPILEMLSPLLSMVAQLFVPIAEVIGTLISALLPPLTTILSTVIELLSPIIGLLGPLLEAILVPLGELLSAILVPVLQLLSPLLEALSPILEVIGAVLTPIFDVIGGIIGFLADGVGAVVGFFSNLFGGASESEEAVNGLNESVNGLEETTNKDITLNADTSSYASDISTASAEANATAQENIIETKDISDLNLKLMGTEASSTYSTMAINAEEAWTRMTTAAESGADSIVAAFNRIATAAASASANANINVSASGVPGHAAGTNDFEGGWTTVNERGGELAFLPSGSAIIPADQSDRLMASMTNNHSEDNSSYAPNVTVPIQIMGNADSETVNELESRLPDIIKRALEEFQQDQLTQMTLKNAYA